MSSGAQIQQAQQFEFLPADTVLTGLPVATVAVAPESLTGRAGVAWSELDSELGPVQVAVLRVAEDGPRFALSSYTEAPSPAVTIAADGTASEHDIDVMLELLDIDASELLDRVPARPAGDTRAPITKSALAERVAERSDLSKALSTEVLNQMIEVMSETLSRGDDLQLAGLGKISVTDAVSRSERKASGKRGPRDARFEPAAKLRKL